LEPCLENKNFLIFTSSKFDGEYESTIFTIARHLAQKNRVFYIDHPYTWFDYIKLRKTAGWKLRKRHFSGQADGLIPTQNPNLNIVIMPVVLSINFLPEGKLYRLLLKYNESLIRRRIKKIIQKAGIEKYIYINSFNFHYPDVINGLNPQLTVYHDVDPLILPYDTRHGLISEKILVKNSDLVICTSRQLYDEDKKINPDTYFIPNAADLTHSSKALDENLPVFESIAALEKPVIGYFGNIERRMDFKLLDEVTKENPDKTFVFAGPMDKAFVPDWFFSRPNVHITGAIPYDKMPSVIKGFDAALIPFKRDAVSRSIFPLKLFEYLGAGKPVIATDFNPDLVDFTGDTVYYCSDASSFSEAINKSLAESSEMTAKRIAAAAENTWEERVKVLHKLLIQYLKKKEAC